MGFQDQFAAITQAGQALAPFTHLRIGGPAEFLVTPRTRDELARVVAACHAEKISLRVLGVGTNLVVRDEGVRGVVVRLTAPEFVNVTVSAKTVKAGGGATVYSLIRAAATAGLAGFETLVGITATVGGALRFNAGDKSGEIADHLVRVEVIDPTGRILTRERADIRFGDHDSDLDDPVVLAVEFALEPDDPDAIVKRMRRAWVNRKADEPLSHQAAVRVFRNPHGQTAAHLLDRAGLIRARVGAAEVSDRNANYIVAQPGTKAADVIALCEKMRAGVRDAFGVALEQELKVW
ncbi:MAG TPA: UDP-N-acetylmuramate dehydrogenase [Gemmataceae bacterium]|nr:UDP-N-acetylmuramate dehydrogenase [Gemmataceae bacterium]